MAIEPSARGSAGKPPGESPPLPTIDQANDRPMRFAFADPPYPGMLAWMYKGEKTYKGEVDHAALIASLVDQYDGWALSTGSAYALREVLPLCPAEVRVCAWVKPHGVSGKTFGIHNSWEPLIVMEGRKVATGEAGFPVGESAANLAARS